MCTASWSFSSDQTALCFNRDERKSRPRAQPPTLGSAFGCRYLAPTDSQAGGTWMLVNEHGLCAFVLNNYAAGCAPWPTATEAVSRGELPGRFAACRTVEEAISRFGGCVEAHRFRPFHLGFLDRQQARCLSWDGQSLRELDVSDGFMTTSSYRTESVEGYRRQRWQELRATRQPEADLVAWHRRFHEELAHPDAAFNPFMRRSDSETHCIAMLTIGLSDARLEYSERDPHGSGLLPPIVSVLPLARPAAV